MKSEGSVVAERAVFSIALLDFSELCLVFLDIVSDGKHELLGIFGSHDDTAYNGRLGHAGGCENEVDEEFIGTVAYHCEVGEFTVGYFGTELDLELVFVFVLIRHNDMIN